MMISRNEILYIKSLKHRKSREVNGHFVAEGPKLVSDLANSGMIPERIFCTYEWLDMYPDYSDQLDFDVSPVQIGEMERISFLTNPSQVLGVFRMLPTQDLTGHHKTDLVLVLDDIRDPGNLGTMLRSADWFGIRQIVCSQGSVDLYNSKVVQASMGSIARVNVVEAELRHYFNAILDEAPVYGTFMDGEPIYSSALIPNGHIIIGNEGRGIASELQMYITHRISIPGPLIHSEGKMAESLNASIAAALVIAEFRRQHSAI